MGICNLSPPERRSDGICKDRRGTCSEATHASSSSLERWTMGEELKTERVDSGMTFRDQISWNELAEEAARLRKLGYDPDPDPVPSTLPQYWNVRKGRGVIATYTLVKFTGLYYRRDVKR